MGLFLMVSSRNFFFPHDRQCARDHPADNVFNRAGSSSPPSCCSAPSSPPSPSSCSSSPWT
jgi:hypothetical protein